MIIAAIITVPLVLHFTQHNNQMALSNRTRTQQNTSNILSTTYRVLINAANNMVTNVANSSVITTTGMINAIVNTTVNVANTTTIGTMMPNNSIITIISMTNTTTKTTIGVINFTEISTVIAQNSAITVPTTIVTSSMIKTQYSSALTINSQKYCSVSPCSVPNTYFQAIQLNVSISGTYTFLCNSSIDTFGYLYYNTFDLSNPAINLITSNDDGSGNTQFQLPVVLQISTRYILIATTFNPNTIGPFTITATGVAPISFSSINVSSKNSIYYE
ncbi:unnamed protein product [Adineta steineri]|uniref:Uncharacterized protein n=1 Tax=Adineta steineri TaxID=433720 RepID=A0A814F2M1_9BILA|nr:unnamed protein product [Adineta steineri]CAF1075075.1 unnamed protein product [Adineta steineri]CAF1138169.1 unnamed protein product [Adineta steineri]